MGEIIPILEIAGVYIALAIIFLLPFVAMGTAINQVDKKFEESKYICQYCGAQNYLVREIDGEEHCPRCGKKLGGNRCEKI